MSDDLLKLYGVREQLCRIDDELKAFYGDPDQICGVVESFEVICRSCSKFRSCRIKFKKVEWRCSDVEWDK